MDVEDRKKHIVQALEDLLLTQRQSVNGIPGVFSLEGKEVTQGFPCLEIHPIPKKKPNGNRSTHYLPGGGLQFGLIPRWDTEVK